MVLRPVKAAYTHDHTDVDSLISYISSIKRAKLDLYVLARSERLRYTHPTEHGLSLE